MTSGRVLSVRKAIARVALLLCGVVIGAGSATFTFIHGHRVVTYDDCVLQYLRSGMSVAVGNAIVAACARKYPLRDAAGADWAANAKWRDPKPPAPAPSPVDWSQFKPVTSAGSNPFDQFDHDNGHALNGRPAPSSTVAPWWKKYNAPPSSAHRRS